METITLSTLPAEARPLILCATSRLAQSLNHQYADRMVGAGHTRWDTLNAQTVSGWLAALEDELLLRGGDLPAELTREVLSDFQARLLFEEIIRNSLGGIRDLFDVGAMAADALEAYKLASLWSFKLEGQALSEEQRQFVDWRAQFLKMCDKRGWIDENRLARLLIHVLSEADLSLPKWVLFAGFDRYTPIETGIQEALAKQGIKVGVLEVSLETGNGCVRAYPDTASECVAAACWARDHLAKSPDARLGIVIPDLAGNRNLIQDTLDTYLSPAAFRAGFAEMPRQFNISLGQPLSNYPIIRVALDLLRLMTGRESIAFAEWSRLLVSPFWSAAKTEGDTRAMIDARMREGKAAKVSLKSAEKSARFWSDKFERRADSLLEHLERLGKEAVFSSKSRLPSEWAHTFRKGLEAGGWLAEYTLSSHEFQTRQAFHEELRKLAGLDAVLGEINARTALSRLSQLCSERVFQAKTLGTRAVQVLGALEAAGLQFDALWVMGMNDHAWPPPAKPNPFLPIALQRDLKTPNASVAVQLDFARSVQRRLIHAAREIVFSWPKREGDSELRPSPLLGNLLPGEDGVMPAGGNWVLEAARAGGHYFGEPVLDDVAPPVEEGEHVRGGTGLLRAQAICPAWAYYRFRLGAKKLEAPAEGLDSSARGKLVHDALEYFWKQVVTSEALKALLPDEQQEMLVKATEHALERHDEQPGQEPLTQRQRQLERDRLIKLLNRWLEIERKRETRFSAIANEEEVKVTIQGIEVTMRIDRIDQLEDGTLIIIDYKTGKTVDIKNWASDRITEPQLPIYAAIAKPEGDPVAGVAFGKVRLKSKEAGFAGLVAKKGLLLQVEPFDSTRNRKLYDAGRFSDWASVLGHWEARIKAMADEVRQGIASVTFEKEKSLEYCDVLPLLRLPERQTQLENTVAARSAE